MELIQAIHERRTIRKFKADPVEPRVALKSCLRMPCGRLRR